MIRRHTCLRKNIPALLVATVLTLVIAGCEAEEPSGSTPTSGKLVIYVDEMYDHLIRSLADSFTTNHAPNISIEIRTVQAREAVGELINLYLAHRADTSSVDTSAAVAIIIGRELMDDERDSIAARNLGPQLMELPLAWDGLAVVVPNESPLNETTVERLKESLKQENRPMSSLQGDAGSEPLRFVFPSPNSSSHTYVRERLLDGAETAPPVRRLGSVDSVLDLIAAGEGISLIPWYRAHQDSNRVRTLRVGFTDSLGGIHSPVRVHPTSLVMNEYPMKLRIVGYSFAGIKSPANGFLSWLAGSDVAQQGMVRLGLESENVRFRLTPSE